MDLDEEKREESAIKQACYKAVVKAFYNKRIRETTCKVGELLLHKNESYRTERGGKPSANWEGPYRIK